jgi:hypothetical protein
MVHVISDPNLEEALALVADRAAAINEVLFRESDLGDMKVRGDRASIR